MRAFALALTLSVAAPLWWVTPAIPAAQAQTQADSVRESLSAQGEKLANEETPSELPDIVNDATKVYSDWKTSGWMAGLLALVSMFMAILKFGPINDFFRSRKIMWLKPILAGVFGALAAGIGALIAGQGVWPAITSGIVAGLGAVGLYETAKRRKAENRES